MSYYAIIPHCGIVYDFNQFGKPFLKGHNHLQFNMSHTKDKVAYVIALEHQVGIDIEKKDAAIDITHLTESIMTREETVQFNELDSIDKLHSFFEIWTKKEAISKAIGQGFSYPINDIVVMRPSLDSYASGQNTYYYYNLKMPKDHAGAVAIRNCRINQIVHETIRG